MIDDGSGIDASVVKSAAVNKGLISAEKSASLSDDEALNIIFTSGVSTVEKITEISGRGVGMDLVKTNIEALGGTVALDSRVGKGTMFTIMLPLTQQPSTVC